MDLNRFLEETGITEAGFGHAVSATQPTINRLRHRQRNASPGLALAIERATGGAVTVSDVPMSRKARRDLRRIRSIVMGGGGGAV